MTRTHPQGPQFQQGAGMVKRLLQHAEFTLRTQAPEGYGALTDCCRNCQSAYQDTPENRPRHQVPCTRCGSNGHAACQH